MDTLTLVLTSLTGTIIGLWLGYRRGKKIAIEKAEEQKNKVDEPTAGGENNEKKGG